jgi:hypothetical protein
LRTGRPGKPFEGPFSLQKDGEGRRIQEIVNEIAWPGMSRICDDGRREEDVVEGKEGGDYRL